MRHHDLSDAERAGNYDTARSDAGAGESRAAGAHPVEHSGWVMRSEGTGGASRSRLARPEVEDLASWLIALVPDALGGYLHGSAGAGRLRAQSDLDVLVLVPAPLAESARRRLVDAALERSGRYPRALDGPRPLELTLVVAEHVCPWRFPPPCELHYGEWMRAEIEAGALPEPFDCADLALAVDSVRRCRATLLGPDPRSVLDPVPVGDLVRATTAGIPGLVTSLEHDATNVLLTLARAWYTCEVGQVTTKDGAATWVAGRTDGVVREAVARARLAYLQGVPHRWAPITASDRAAAAALVSMVGTAADRDR